MDFAYILPLAILFHLSIRTILSPDYADAIRQSAYVHIRPRLPLWIKLLLVILLSLIALGLFYLSQPRGAHPC